MESITSNLFTNITKNKNKSITDSTTKFSQNETKNIYPSPALSQGKKFKKYQNEISKNIEIKTDIYSKEGFTSNTLEAIQQNNEYKNKLFDETNSVIKQTDYSSYEDNINALKKEYSNTLNKYNSLLNQINVTTDNYFKRVNSSNPYLGKNVYSTIEPKPLGYVTMQGVFKWYTNWDIVNATAGKNGCPGITQESWKSAIPINVSIDYNNPGAIINTNPPLIVGSPMIAGQSCGNEGSNVFVNSLMEKSLTSYEGCYQDSIEKATMTFIGNKPSSKTNKIINGLFKDPKINKNSYLYINDNVSVPGWNISKSDLINNSSAWGYKMPYPFGDQAISIQKTNFISQVVSLEKDVNYTLSFYASGRNCCDGSRKSNPISIYLNQANNNNSKVSIFDFEAVINEWKYYTSTITISNTGNYIITFQGKFSQGDRSTAIQNIQIQDNSTNSSSKGTYSIDTCEQAALSGGYQYFALQDVNPSNSLGYCAVSNSQPAATKLGKAFVPNKLINIWSSNTVGQTGNTATISISGSLSVLNSSGTSIFSTDNSNAKPSNYMGCYGDTNNRAMYLYNNGQQQYNYEQCSELAKKNGFSYFGLQNSTSGTKAQCALSNNLDEARKYGKAGNCTKLNNGNYSGGGWSNAIYNYASPSSNYFLYLQDDGNMCIYRGTGPNDMQGTIWCSGTNGKQLQPNPNYAASKSKYGKNFISTGDTLAIGDFVGSNDGSIYLIMQSDGNLVLYTSENIENCSKMSNGKMGGGVNANALYNIGQQAFSDNIGQLGYIDPNSELHVYPNSNKKFNQNYSSFPGNNPGNDIAGTQYSNATLEQCKNTCNSKDSCAGFVYDNKNNVCWPKNSNIYPNSKLVENNDNFNYSTYIRGKQPSTTPIGVPKNIKNIDSISYQNYPNGGNFADKYGLAKYTDIQQQELSQLESTLNMLSELLNNLTGVYENSNNLVNNQSNKNILGLVDYSDQKIKTEKKIRDFPQGTNLMIDDSNIVVLQKNYEYLLWSSIAIGVLIITLGYYRK